MYYGQTKAVSAYIAHVDNNELESISLKNSSLANNNLNLILKALPKKIK